MPFRNDTVDNQQRRRLADGADTTDAYLESLAGLCGSLRDLNAWSLRLHGGQGVGGVHLRNLVAGYLECGTGHQLTLLRAVAHYHYFVQVVLVFLKHNVDDVVVADLNFRGLVSDIAELENVALLGFDGEFAVDVSVRSDSRPFHQY